MIEIDELIEDQYKAMSFYLKYVEKQLATNEDYPIYPGVKAISMAIEKIDSVEIGETIMTMSGNAEITPNNQPTVHISAVFKRKADKIEILEMIEFNMGNEIPFYHLTKLLQAEIKLDKYDFPIRREQLEDIFTSLLPGLNLTIVDHTNYKIAMRRAFVEIKNNPEKFSEFGLTINGSYHKLTHQLIKEQFSKEWISVDSFLRAMISQVYNTALGNLTGNFSFAFDQRKSQYFRYDVQELLIQILTGPIRDWVSKARLSK